MKKKFGIIVAILLCAVLLFSFAACGGGKQPEAAKESIPGVTDAQIAEMDSSIGAYLDSWLLANAQEDVTDQTAVLKSALGASDAFTFMNREREEYAPVVQVTFDENSNKYTVVFSWNKGALKKTYVKEAKVVTYTNWAGKMNKTADYTALTEEGEAAGAIDKIVNAAFSTINNVGTNAQTAKFGVDGTIGFEVMGYNYGLQIKGNVDLESRKDTELALLIVDSGKNVRGGLYYQGAEEDKDCKIILQIGEKYRYLDYAILNDLLSKILTPAEDAGEDFLPTGTLAEILAHYNVNSTIASTVSAVIDMIAQGYVKEGTNETTYMIDINLSTVVSTLSELLGDVLSGVSFEGIPYLEDLDIATMHGLLGHVTIAATVAGEEEDELTDFELAVNLPACTFYLNEEEGEDATKLDIPSISFALYLNDFSFITEGKIANVIPAEAADAEYFSPTNVNVSGDLYINDTNIDLDDTFHFSFVTNVNPFKPSKAAGSLVIKQSQGATYNEATASNFLTITYEQSSKTLCVSGTAFGMDEDDGNTIYTFSFADGSAALDTIKHWLGLDNWQGIGFDEEHGLYISDEAIAKSSAKALLQNDLAQAITKYYAAKMAENTYDEGEETLAAEDEGFSFDMIGDLFSGVKDLYDQLAKGGAIVIGDGSAKIDVTPEVINTVTAALNEMLNLDLPTDIDDPKFVKLYFNYKDEDVDYTDKLFATVSYGGNLFEITFDGSKDNEFTINFVMTTSTRIYTCVVTAEDEVETESATKWTFDVTFDITDKEGNSKSHTEVKLSNFHANWGADNTDNLELYSAEEKAGATSIFADDGVATKLVEKIVSFLNKDAIEPYAEKVGKMIVDMIL